MNYRINLLFITRVTKAADIQIKLVRFRNDPHSNLDDQNNHKKRERKFWPFSGHTLERQGI